jgi:predicted nucleic acid-binding protein
LSSSVLVDTNILLRLSRREDADYTVVNHAVAVLTMQGAMLHFAHQNIAEFWNVATRRIDQNGWGLRHEQVDSLVIAIETKMAHLPETGAVYYEWRRLIRNHRISGVKVHDARLVATMNTHGIENILTLNTGDFERYPGIIAIHPRSIAERPVH